MYDNMLRKPKTKLGVKCLQQSQGSKESKFRRLKLMCGEGGNRKREGKKSLIRLLDDFILLRVTLSAC